MSDIRSLSIGLPARWIDQLRWKDFERKKLNLSCLFPPECLSEGLIFLTSACMEWYRMTEMVNYWAVPCRCCPKRVHLSWWRRTGLLGSLPLQTRLSRHALAPLQNPGQVCVAVPVFLILWFCQYVAHRLIVGVWTCLWVLHLQKAVHTV